MIIIEKALQSKMNYEKHINCGHDCWGNTDFYTEYYIKVNGKSEQIFDDMYVIRKEDKALEVGYIDSLPSNVRKFLDNELFEKIEEEKKEKRYKHYLELKKEFENDMKYNRDEKIDNILK